MAAVNRYGKGAGCPGTVPESNNDLEESDSGLNILCDDLMKDDSALIINIFELFKQTIFTDAYKNCNDTDICGDCHSCNSFLVGQIFTGTMFCDWAVKAEFS